MNNLKEVINELNEIGEDIEFYGANNISNIIKVENFLDVAFDNQYKDFLKEYGGGGIIDIISTNGILSSDPLNENVFTVLGATLYARMEFNLEKKYLVINSDFPEKCWVIDTENHEKNSVYAYDTIKNKIIKKIYEDFDSYLYNEFNEYLKEIS